jgi:putative transposase
MRIIDEFALDNPTAGSRMIRDYLRLEGFEVNRKRVQRLMKLMGIEAIYPRRGLSSPEKGHKVFPYLLRGVEITHPNQVWSLDITYVPVRNGFFYLVALIDWYSRFILSWRISNSLSNDFCVEAIKEAFELYGAPEICNSDQGSQFTAENFVTVVQGQGTKISMDGKGRALDNVYIERFWRTIKYDDYYLRDYKCGTHLIEGTSSFMTKYNYRRPHSSLEGKTPASVYLA